MLPESNIANTESSSKRKKVLILPQGAEEEITQVIRFLGNSFECIIDTGDTAETISSECICALLIPGKHSNDQLQLAKYAKHKFENTLSVFLLRPGIKINIDEILATGINDVALISCEEHEISSNLTQLLAS